MRGGRFKNNIQKHIMISSGMNLTLCHFYVCVIATYFICDISFMTWEKKREMSFPFLRMCVPGYVWVAFIKENEQLKYIRRREKEEWKDDVEKVRKRYITKNK